MERGDFNLCDIAVIRSLMADAGITFRKEYGQNFLTSNHIVDRIADAAADTEESLILEIGPGIGCLTKALALRYRKVLAVEIDRGLLPILDRTLAPFENTKVVSGDAMKLDLPSLIESEREGLPVSVCANLPYYITTPILMRLLECGYPFRSLTLMVQSEVADRLTAAPGSGEYGAITAVLAYYGVAKRLFTVSAGHFCPAPKVDSAVVGIDLSAGKRYAPQSEKRFLRTVKAAFEQRRKTLVNALSPAFPELGKERIREAILALGLSEQVRGERLSTEEFVKLSDLLQ